MGRFYSREQSSGPGCSFSPFSSLLVTLSCSLPSRHHTQVFSLPIFFTPIKLCFFFSTYPEARPDHFLSQDFNHFAYICSYLVIFSFFVWCPYPLWIGLQFLVTNCDECVFLACNGQASVAMSAQYILSLGSR